jgi:AcrR family transcriptional regulator
VPIATRNAATTTRERILQTSLQLFNVEGLPSTSTHRIAAELGMSPGNLHYHFKTKQLIVDRLFRRFEEQMLLLDGSFESIRAIDDLWLALHLRFEAINAYRFVYRDMAFIASEYPSLGARVQALTAQNLLAAQALCQGLVAAGVIEASEEQVQVLALQMVFTTTCWLSFERLVPGRQAGQAGGQADPGLAAYYTLTLVSPYVSKESRPYLDYLRAKYLG